MLRNSMMGICGFLYSSYQTPNTTSFRPWSMEQHGARDALEKGRRQQMHSLIMTDKSSTTATTTPHNEFPFSLSNFCQGLLGQIFGHSLFCPKLVDAAFDTWCFDHCNDPLLHFFFFIMCSRTHQENAGSSWIVTVFCCVFSNFHCCFQRLLYIH